MSSAAIRQTQNQKIVKKRRRDLEVVLHKSKTKVICNQNRKKAKKKLLMTCLHQAKSKRKSKSFSIDIELKLLLNTKTKMTNWYCIGLWARKVLLNGPNLTMLICLRILRDGLIMLQCRVSSKRMLSILSIELCFSKLCGQIKSQQPKSKQSTLWS